MVAQTVHGRTADSNFRAVDLAHASLSALARVRLTLLNRTWLIVLRVYIVIAARLVLVHIVQLVSAGQSDPRSAGRVWARHPPRHLQRG